MSEDPQTTKRFRLRIWHVLAGLVILCLTVFVIFILTGKSQLEAKIAELKEKGYPTSYEELIEQRKLPDGVPNAADTYTKAFMAYQAPFAEIKAQLPILGDAQLPEPGQPMPEEMKAAIDQFLQKNKQCLDLLHEAAQIKECYFVPNMKIPALPLDPYNQSIRYSAQLLTLAAVHAANHTDSESSYQYVTDAFGLVHACNRGFFLIEYLVQLSVAQIGLSTLEHALNHVNFNEKYLTELDRQLATLPSNLDFARALRGDMVWTIEFYRNPDSMGMGQPSKPQPLSFIGVMERNATAQLEFLERYITALQLPSAERNEEFTAITADSTRLSLLYFFTKAAMPSYEQINFHDLRVHATVHSARAAVAIERYRLAKGKLPEALEELVPIYLEEIPFDPFDGEPLRYKQTHPGYIVYSIGEDQVDNGGIPKSESNGESFDWPFTIRR
ncbi:MAG: hypothetical protein JW828_09905 [Sedimentisphaerales bacterium]|nr:hypothetical protein [Sedimentisphaerales bacterium]